MEKLSAVSICFCLIDEAEESSGLGSAPEFIVDLQVHLKPMISSDIVLRAHVTLIITDGCIHCR